MEINESIKTVHSMKLYATVTSERASKGQGGNKYLEVRFTASEDYRVEPSETEITARLTWNNGNPIFMLWIPEAWKLDEEGMEKSRTSRNYTVIVAKKAKSKKANSAIARMTI